jgi:hypothetical protein
LILEDVYEKYADIEAAAYFEKEKLMKERNEQRGDDRQGGGYQ